jgi:hypothetical protein
MEAGSSSTVAAASAAVPGTVQGAAAIDVLKKAIDMRTSPALQLVEALRAPPALPTPTAPTGSVGTQVNTFA